MLLEEELDPQSGAVAGVRSLALATLLLGLGGCTGAAAAPARAAEVKGARAAKPEGSMVLIAAGRFTMGCDAKKEARCDSRESPAHEVDLDAYYMDVQEVSVGEYAACVKAGHCAPLERPDDKSCTASHHDPSLPLDCVSHVQATAYCTWMGKRLPTEAEWEKAGRGADRRRFAWGNDPEPTCENLGRWASKGPAACAFATARPRGTFPLDRSPFGVLDMTGGVSELVADNYAVHYYAESPVKNPTGPARREFDIVIRGGNYTRTAVEGFQVWRRGYHPPTAAVPGTGFRCARSANDKTPVRALAASTVTTTAPSAAPGTASGKPALDAATCSDPCALLTEYPYDDLVANACTLCKPHDDTFCELDFPWNDVPACDAYDELRNCIFARFGFVFSKPKWQKQFGAMPWYKPDAGFTEAKLPPVARANVQRLKELKAKQHGCR
jgi:formylglycine-generating enzyme required for sulfatase activity